MVEVKFGKLLRTLNLEDWNMKVNAEWTVKDLVAHMIGWDRSDAEAIKQIWKTKQPPAWMDASQWGKLQDDEFNAKWVDYYKTYTPKELLSEWEFWQGEVRGLVAKFGQEEMRRRSDLFGWLFVGEDGASVDTTPGHYKHHYLQLRKLLSK